MSDLQHRIEAHLGALVGRALCESWRAADMRAFEFDDPKVVGAEAELRWSLHVQCPWRMETPDCRVATGRLDLWEPATDVVAVSEESWDYETDGNLQDEVMLTLLDDAGGSDDSNADADWIVAEIVGDEYGGAQIHFRNGFRLVLFPAGSRGEDWRSLPPGRGRPHFVISGGQIDGSC